MWNNGKSAGKSAGKSLNYWGSDDYYAAWGWEDNENNYSGYGDYGAGNYIGNVAMMPKKGKGEKTSGDDETDMTDSTRHDNDTDTTDSTRHDGDTTTTTTIEVIGRISGERDPLLNMARIEDVKLRNRYTALEDSVDEGDSEDEAQCDGREDE